MKDFLRVILVSLLFYFAICWAADHPTGVKKLRDDIRSAAASTYEYVKSLCEDEV
jgi:hypothetical protein